MARRLQREGRDTRRLIVDRAAEQFALWGYSGASISGIAAAVGVSKPTLYHHFTDKEEIYVEIVTSVLADMARRVAAAAACPSPSQRGSRRSWPGTGSGAASPPAGSPE